MVHAWVEHIRKYAKEHNLTYPNAMRDPNCKATYKSKQGSDSKRAVEGGSGAMKRLEEALGYFPTPTRRKEIVAAMLKSDNMTPFTEEYERLNERRRTRFVHNIIKDIHEFIENFKGAGKPMMTVLTNKYKKLLMNLLDGANPDARAGGARETTEEANPDARAGGAAEGKGTTEGKGLSKRPRRFAKGSKEAKDYMAALRAKRKKNG